ncbi:MAG TPA: glycosyltransferase WbuB [Anaerolineae bacterium]|nr:glycosyltransferase WbuB [Anaerolineae bacterium]
MRITFLLTQSLESPSGLGRYWPLSKELVRLGHKVVILALHHDFRTLGRRRFIREGVEVHYVGQMHVRKVGSSKFYFGPTRLVWVATLATWRLMRAALRTPTDVYHLGKPHPMNGLAGLVASRLRCKPLYLDCDDYEAVSNRFDGDWQRQIVSFVECLLPRFSDGITVNTRFMLRRLSELGVSERRLIYVPNGVERSRFSSVSDDDVDRLRSQLGLEGTKVVLYLGSMSLANHAVDLLLEAFVIVRQVEPDTVLLLVGGGEDYDVLRVQASVLGLDNAALFVGRVSPARAPLYYYLADVSVDPVYGGLTAQARFPLKIVESLAAGTPVVTGDVGDRREILGGGEAGALVPPGDKQALASGILRVLQKAEVATRMRRAAEALGHTYYWDALAPGFLKIYELR